MRGYRAAVAFDGERAIPGGALVLVEDGLIVGVEPAAFPARSLAAGVDGIEHCSCLTAGGPHLPTDVGDRLAAAGTYVCPTLGRIPVSTPRRTCRPGWRRWAPTTTSTWRTWEHWSAPASP